MRVRADYNGPMTNRTAPFAPMALFSMAVGGFAIGTTEFATMGVLPEIAKGMQVSIPQAGHFISAYAIGVVVGAPVLAVLFARTPRKVLLLGLMVAFAIGNAFSALATTSTQLWWARFIAGLPHGAFFGVASLVGAQLVGHKHRAKAVAAIMMGLNVATLAGVPLATWIGRRLDWPAVYWLVAGLAAACLLLMMRFVPKGMAGTEVHPMDELKSLTRQPVVIALLTGAIGGCGLFSAFSYIVPTLEQHAGVPSQTVAWILAMFGVGQIIGSLTAAHFADRALLPAIKGCLLWSALCLVIFALLCGVQVLAAPLVFLIGTMVALANPLQIRLMDVSGEAQTLAAAGNHASFNLANAMGAWLGGLVLTWGWGYPATGWVGAVLALLGLALFVGSRQRPVPHREA